MKFEECEDCYFYGVEPAMCDECHDADQFEPMEPDDDAFGRLLELSKPAKRANVIPIRQVPIKARAKPDEEEEPQLHYA